MRKTVLLPVLIGSIVFVGCISAAQRSQWNARRGEELLEAGKYKRAVRRLEAAERARAGDAKLMFLLGSTYLYLGRYREAAERLEKVIETEPKNYEAWFRLGNACLNMDKFDLAAAAYRMAIEVKPDFLEAVEALAMLYPDGGVTREEALAMWKRAFELETRDEWITRAEHYIEKLKNEGND